MIIKKIHIENFRAYKEFDCEFDKGINLVIGDNGGRKNIIVIGNGSSIIGSAE